MKLKAIWHKGKKMPSKAQIEASYEGKGKFVAISPSIFGGWHVWLLAKKGLTLSSPDKVSNDPLIEEYRKKNKAFKISHA